MLHQEAEHVVRVELPRVVRALAAERARRKLDLREVGIVDLSAEPVVDLVVRFPERQYSRLIVGNAEQLHPLCHGKEVLATVGACEEGVHVTVYSVQYRHRARLCFVTTVINVCYRIYRSALLLVP